MYRSHNIIYILYSISETISYQPKPPAQQCLMHFPTAPDRGSRLEGVSSEAVAAQPASGVLVCLFGLGWKTVVKMCAGSVTRTLPT